MGGIKYSYTLLTGLPADLLVEWPRGQRYNRLLAAFYGVFIGAIFIRVMVDAVMPLVSQGFATFMPPVIPS